MTTVTVNNTSTFSDEFQNGLFRRLDDIASGIHAVAKELHTLNSCMAGVGSDISRLEMNVGHVGDCILACRDE